MTRGLHHNYPCLFTAQNTPKTIEDTASRGDRDQGEFSVGFIDHPELEKINKNDKKNSKYSKPSYCLDLGKFYRFHYSYRLSVYSP